MLKRFTVLAVFAMAVTGAARAAEPLPSPGGGGGTSVFLRAPLPGAPKSCPDAQPAGGDLVKVPLFGENSASCPVASIDGTEMITVDDLASALAETHGGGHGGSMKAGRQDPTAIVNRLIDARLIVLEAQAMGIEELPETKKVFEGVDAATGREMLKERVLADVKADPALTERLFQDKVREYQLQSVLFPRESDAAAAAKEIKAGKSFDQVVTRAVADKKAKGNEPGQFVPWTALVPNVLGAVQKTPVGKSTPPVKVTGGYALIEVEAVRYPQNAAARSEAEATSLLESKKAALKKYYDGLVKRYAKIDEKLLKKIDFEAKKPGFEALKKDTRVVATIQGKPPITVGDLAKALQEQFFHGVENATQGKRLNKTKGTTLDALISPQVVGLEVARLGLDKTDEYRRRSDEGKNGVVFGAFVQKVVVPDVKLDEAQVRAWYDAHPQDYSVAAFYKVESIGFGSQKAAEAAVAKLRGGTDFKWLNANADGKLPEGKDTERPSGVISSKAATPAFAKVMEGARSGDYRVYAAPGDQFYAVHVIQVTPPSLQPYEEVREPITQKLYGEALQRSIRDWMDKLRKAHKVEVYLTRLGS